MQDMIAIVAIVCLSVVAVVQTTVLAMVAAGYRHRRVLDVHQSNRLAIRRREDQVPQVPKADDGSSNFEEEKPVPVFVCANCGVDMRYADETSIVEVDATTDVAVVRCGKCGETKDVLTEFAQQFLKPPAETPS